MTTSTPSRDHTLSRSETNGPFDNSSKLAASVPGQREDRRSTSSDHMSSAVKGEAGRNRSLDEQTATDIAAGW